MSIDIDSLLISVVSRKKTTEELEVISGTGSCIVEAFNDGIAAIGTLAYWAADNKTMEEDEMRVALKGIGMFLSIAAPLMDKVEFITNEAYGEVRDRTKGGFKNESK